MDERVEADLRDSYGISFDKCVPVTGGWLNLKWKISTGRGEFLVKQFSRARFDKKKLLYIEAALERQMALHSFGVPCPAILPSKGRAIRFLDDGTAYMVMEFCLGHVEKPETVTPQQMESLGDAAGKMRGAFARLPSESAAGYPLRDEAALAALWKNFETRAGECPENAPAGYRAAVSALGPILRTLTPAWFERLPKGIAHEDFARDNMLFGDDQLSAILDFDRGLYTYVWHDLGRALMSLAFRESRLDIPKIDAFQRGYNKHLPLSRADIADAIRLVWCVETPWWILPQFFGDCPEEKVARFRDEMLWLTENWFDLDAMLR
jgi:homoserine kinase type II